MKYGTSSKTGVPDPAGGIRDIPHREWQDDMRAGYEVVVADLPEHVKIIRFWNSW